MEINGCTNLSWDNIKNLPKNFKEVKREKKLQINEEEKKEEKEKSFSIDKQTKTDSQVIVKPDGSRVLFVTVNIGGMQRAMAIKLSEPNELDTTKQTQENEEQNNIENIMLKDTILEGE